MSEVFDQHALGILVMITLIATLPLTAYFIPGKVAMMLVLVFPQGRIFCHAYGFADGAKKLKYFVLHEALVLGALLVVYFFRF